MADEAPFEVVLAHLDGYLRVKLRGDLDYTALASEQAATLREVSDIRERVVIDLSEVKYMDSSGLAMLVNIANHHDGPLRLEGAQPIVRRVLEVTGLVGVFELVE